MKIERQWFLVLASACGLAAGLRLLPEHEEPLLAPPAPAQAAIEAPDPGAELRRLLATDAHPSAAAPDDDGATEPALEPRRAWLAQLQDRIARCEDLNECAVLKDKEARLRKALEVAALRTAQAQQDVSQ